MSFKPVFIMPSGERATNSQCFATEQEARSSAAARFMVWTMPSAYDTEYSVEDVNYLFDGKDMSI